MGFGKVGFGKVGFGKVGFGKVFEGADRYANLLQPIRVHCKLGPHALLLLILANVVQLPSRPKGVKPLVKIPNLQQIFFDCDNALAMTEDIAFRQTADLVNEFMDRHQIEERYSGERLVGLFMGLTFKQMMPEIAGYHAFELTDEDLKGCHPATAAWSQPVTPISAVPANLYQNSVPTLGEISRPQSNVPSAHTSPVGNRSAPVKFSSGSTWILITSYEVDHLVVCGFLQLLAESSRRLTVCWQHHWSCLYTDLRDRHEHQVA